VPGAPPAGEPAPRDGTLPGRATAGLAGRPFGIYVHVPFCQTRCGYCDFNTYTAAELGGGASRDIQAAREAAASARAAAAAAAAGSTTGKDQS